MDVKRLSSSLVSEDICHVQSLIPSHEDIEVDVGLELSEGRHVRVGRNDLALHQLTNWHVQAEHVSLHGQFELVLRLLPSLKSLLDSISLDFSG